MSHSPDCYCETCFQLQCHREQAEQAEFEASMQQEPASDGVITSEGYANGGTGWALSKDSVSVRTADGSVCEHDGKGNITVKDRNGQVRVRLGDLPFIDQALATHFSDEVCARSAADLGMAEAIDALAYDPAAEAAEHGTITLISGATISFAKALPEDKLTSRVKISQDFYADGGLVNPDAFSVKISDDGRFATGFGHSPHQKPEVEHSKVKTAVCNFPLITMKSEEIPKLTVEAIRKFLAEETNYNDIIRAVGGKETIEPVVVTINPPEVSRIGRDFLDRHTIRNARIIDETQKAYISIDPDRKLEAIEMMMRQEFTDRVERKGCSDEHRAALTAMRSQLIAIFNFLEKTK